MSGILWHVEQKLEGILDGILMEFHMLISEDKNQIQKLMNIPWYLSLVFMVQGYILTVLKVLYGLRSSGKRWTEVIHGKLRDMKFFKS